MAMPEVSVSTFAPETVPRVVVSAYYGELRAIYDFSLELARRR